MESLETTACFGDDLLDFPSDISDDDEDDVVLSTSSQRRPGFSLLPPAHLSTSFSGFVEEEELEWISNKDAFPMVETFVDIMPNHPSISNNNGNGNGNGNGTSSSSHLSPVSVLENSTGSSITSNHFNFSSSNSRGGDGGGGGAAVTAISAMISLTGIFKVPGKARSKLLRKRRKELSREQFQCWEKVKPVSKAVSKPSSGIGRKCLHCGAEKTPQWRAGPYGPKTLCNACGVRYKSGRLVPEYRPASSPTFSIEKHSNSHRKIVEMRKQKMVHGGELEVPLPREHVG